jgi:hypothetical protein
MLLLLLESTDPAAMFSRQDLNVTECKTRTPAECRGFISRQFVARADH